MHGITRQFQERMRNEGRILGEMPERKTPAAPGLTEIAQLEALVSASLSVDLEMLSGESSNERKGEIKRDVLLPKYASYVARLKAVGSKHEILGYQFVWLFDAGHIGEALEYAKDYMASGGKLPERFNSSPGFFVANQFITWAEKACNDEHDVEPYFSEVFAAAKDWNLPDTLTARFYRLRGLRAMQMQDFKAAVPDLERALELGAKVETKLKEARKKITD